MSVIVMVSGKGSPGVSCAALALGLTWPLRARGDQRAPQRVLVVEADPSGSSAVPGYLCGNVDPDQGMAAVVRADGPQMGQALRDVVIEIEGQLDRYLVPGFSGPALATAHQQAWPRMAGWLRSTSQAAARSDVLVDLGRVGSAAEPTALLEAADLVMVVCRATLPSVLGASHAAVHVQGRCTAPVVCLLVADGPYSPTEVEASLDIPVVGVLAWDPASAEVFSHGRPPARGFTRGPLLRSASRFATHVMAHLAAGARVEEGTSVDA